MGEQPDWYALLRAARYLRVPPWELAHKPIFWTEVALAAMEAEGRAKAHAERRRSSPRK
jgi:hypothetical protein